MQFALPCMHPRAVCLPLHVPVVGPTLVFYLRNSSAGVGRSLGCLTPGHITGIFRSISVETLYTTLEPVSTCLRFLCLLAVQGRRYVHLFSYGSHPFQLLSISPFFLWATMHFRKRLSPHHQPCPTGC
eukprot:Tbor_TRINITY_DN5900_c6_g1::TRINITY_DN5900_c6_g1_i13::g.18208::m.18208